MERLARTASYGGYLTRVMFTNNKLTAAKKEVSDFITSSIDVEVLLDIIREQFSPEDVFGEDVLHDWARENGYSKAE